MSECGYCGKPFAYVSIGCKNADKHKQPDSAELIVAHLEKEIMSRRGIGQEYDSYDHEIQQEIREAFAAIIRKHSN